MSSSNRPFRQVVWDVVRVAALAMVVCATLITLYLLDIGRSASWDRTTLEFFRFLNMCELVAAGPDEDVIPIPNTFQARSALVR